MSNIRRAEKESFYEVPETCPKVDRALDAASELIKEQTGLLREALIAALERALDAEERVEELETEVRELREELDSIN
jgi:hypothetical protein